MSNAIDNLYTKQAVGGYTQEQRPLTVPSVSPQAMKDTISLTMGNAVLDEEAQEVMEHVQQDMQVNRDEALAAHPGLDYSRVMALLDGL